jgi:hypothetical protein
VSGWIGVDLDGTLAHYDGWKGHQHIGDPVPAMADRVRRWLALGQEVRIFTARAWPKFAGQPGSDLHDSGVEAVQFIENWCLLHFGRVLPVTCVKDYSMIERWDDRAVRVKMNSGYPCCTHEVTR